MDSYNQPLQQSPPIDDSDPTQAMEYTPNFGNIFTAPPLDRSNAIMNDSPSIIATNLQGSTPPLDLNSQALVQAYTPRCPTYQIVPPTYNNTNSNYIYTGPRPHTNAYPQGRTYSRNNSTDYSRQSATAPAPASRPPMTQLSSLLRETPHTTGQSFNFTYNNNTQPNSLICPNNYTVPQAPVPRLAIVSQAQQLVPIQASNPMPQQAVIRLPTPQTQPYSTAILNQAQASNHAYVQASSAPNPVPYPQNVQMPAPAPAQQLPLYQPRRGTRLANTARFSQPRPRSQHLVNVSRPTSHTLSTPATPRAPRQPRPSTPNQVSTPQLATDVPTQNQVRAQVPIQTQSQQTTTTPPLPTNSQSQNQTPNPEVQQPAPESAAVQQAPVYVSSTTRTVASIQNIESIQKKVANKACQANLAKEMMSKFVTVKPGTVDSSLQTDESDQPIPLRKTYVDRACSPIPFTPARFKQTPKRRRAKAPSPNSESNVSDAEINVME